MKKVLFIIPKYSRWKITGYISLGKRKIPVYISNIIGCKKVFQDFIENPEPMKEPNKIWWSSFEICLNKKEK